MVVRAFQLCVIFPQWEIPRNKNVFLYARMVVNFFMWCPQKSIIWIPPWNHWGRHGWLCGLLFVPFCLTPSDIDNIGWGFFCTTTRQDIGRSRWGIRRKSTLLFWVDSNRHTYSTYFFFTYTDNVTCIGIHHHETDDVWDDDPIGYIPPPPTESGMSYSYH